MGFGSFIKGQLIDVIEFMTDDKNILAHKFDAGKKQIMMGAKLTVRPGQRVVFINEGEMADIYEEGLYTLSTSNMPLLTKLKSWKYGFESPFKVDIYFISVDEKISQTWGTPSKIAVKDPDFGMLRIGANGLYSYKVTDPKIFIEKLVGTDREYTVSECRKHLNGQFTTSFTDFFGEAKVTLFEAYGNINEFSEQILGEVKPSFVQYGFELVSFNIREIRVPEVVETAMDERASVAALGGMDMYQRKTLTDATADAAVNMSKREGGSGTAGFGMEMATGMAMGNMMGGMMGGMVANQNRNQQATPAQAQPVQAQAQPVQAKPMTSCSKCQASVAVDARFCQSCGNDMTVVKTGNSCSSCHATITTDAKFCPECGTKQEAKKAFCAECGVEQAEGSKFCPNCGLKQ